MERLAGAAGRVAVEAGCVVMLHTHPHPPLPQVITPRTDCFNHKLASQVCVRRVLCIKAVLAVVAAIVQGWSILLPHS